MKTREDSVGLAGHILPTSATMVGVRVTATGIICLMPGPSAGIASVIMAFEVG